MRQRHQTTVLYVSTMAGVLLGMLSSIVNTRFLPPVDYGDVRYVQNIANFIAAFLLFGYFLSGSRLLAISTDRLYSRRLKGVMIIILGVASVLLCLSMAVCYFLHADRPQLAWLFIVSMPVCFVPLYFNYIEQATTGEGLIGRLALARLLPYLCYVPLAYVLYSLYGATSQRMILLQWGVYTLIYVAIIISTKPLFSQPGPIWSRLQQENRSFGIHLYVGSLVMVATNYLAGISLGYWGTDNTEVGFYTLALTVTSPLAALPAIVGTTHFKKFASQSRIPQKVIITTLLLTTLSCVVFLLIIKPVVTFLYTDSYAIVGTYASFLSIAFCIHGLGDMFNRFLCAHGQGIQVRNASIANGVFKVIGYTVFVALFSTHGAIATTILCDVIYCSCLVYYYQKFINTPVHE